MAGDKTSRASLSCDSCRSRKSKCRRLPNGSCQRCAAANKECITSTAKSSRPYYQTSKEQFELLQGIMSHFLPQVSLDVEDLRAAATALGVQRSSSLPVLPNATASAADSIGNSSALRHFPQHPALSGDATPPLEALQFAENSMPRTIHATNATSISMNEPPRSLPNVAGPTSNSEDTLVIDATATSRDLDLDTTSTTSDDSEAHEPKRVLENKSGWASFYQKIHDKFWPSSNGIVIPHSSPALYTDTGHTKTFFPTNLPSKESVERALLAFFSEVNNVVFILDFGEFEQTVANIYDNKLPSSAASVMGLLAVVALAERSASSFDAAYHYLNQVLVERSVESVQAIMLLTLCRLSRWELDSAWVLLGCARRIAYSIGLNKMSETETGERRRSKVLKTKLWWSLYSIDASLTCGLGQPPDRGIVTRRQVIDGMDKDDFYVQPYTPPGYVQASATLGTIADEILSRMYSDTGPLHGGSKPADVHDMLSVLNHWTQTLPSHLTMQDSIAHAYMRPVGHLHLRHNEYITMLTRNHLLDSKHRGHDLTVCCEEANKRSVMILRRLKEANLLSTTNYLDGIYMMSSGMILLLRAFKWPGVDMLAELEEYLPILQQMVDVKAGRLALEAMSSYVDALRISLQSASTFHEAASSPSFANVNFDDFSAFMFATCGSEWANIPP